MSASAAASAAVTDEDVRLYLTQSIDDYQEACVKGFSEHKFNPVTAGLTIGNHVMKNIIDTSMANVGPGQKATMEGSDLFTMVSVLAKTNVAVLTSLDRAQYHEKMSRALTAEVNSMKDKAIETGEKGEKPS